MRIVVFTGPTLGPSAAAAALPDAEVLPPAACGDVYRALATRPDVIVIIDGVFDQRQSVWHKEILWALRNGTRVFGAASLGALRAVELEPFGMVGVGRVFNWFKTGQIDRDDEVAVAHDTVETGYRARSEALVNVRVTLERAVRDRAISAAAADGMLLAGQRLYYPDRSFEAIIEGSRQCGVPEADLQGLQKFLNEGKRIDQKRADALAALECVKLLRPDRPSASPRFQFQYTEAWHEFRRRMGAQRPASS